MKKASLLLTLLFLLSAMPPAAIAAESCKTPQAIATVNGMVCDFCVQSLKKVFLKEPGVDKVDIDLTTKHVTLTLKPGQTLDDSTIKNTVEWGGYDLVKVDRPCS